MPVILATKEAEVGGQGTRRKTIPYLKNKLKQKGLAGGMKNYAECKK
jgi:hypothetical protein